MITIEGTVEDIIYSNEITGYTVCDVWSDKDMVTAVGYMPFLNPGESVRLTGKWVNHPDYGDQLKVDYYEKVMPQTLEALEKYLASGVIKGVGPATAERIVEAFGNDTFDIITYRPQQLSEIKGISLEKAIRIGHAFAEQNGLRTIMIFLQEFGISPSCCMEILRVFGEDAINIIKQDPYKLSEKISSINFKSADMIAMKLGIDPSSRHRVCCGMKHVLSRASSNGHTWLPASELKSQTLGLLQIEDADMEDAFATLLFDRQIYSEKASPEDRIYLKSMYDAEVNVARSLLALIGYNTGKARDDIDKRLERLQQDEGIELAELQKTAIKEAMTEGVLVITGGPGTGKTTIINSMIKLLEQEGMKAELAAPTGRAAKRLSEATGREARTIHRLLEIGYSGDEKEMIFQKNEHNPIDTDFIIIDEMSMVDILLMSHLLKAVPAGARLILVGDANQLPSVGAGNVLKDVINSGLIKTVRLEEIFRQAQESMIIVNAHRINKGEKPFLNLKGKDFYYVCRRNPESIVETVKDLCVRRLPESYGYDPMKQIQVLTPTRKGLPGVVYLN
jgi:exodeoxyribonuclease V alpha subunit